MIIIPVQHKESTYGLDCLGSRRLFSYAYADKGKYLTKGNSYYKNFEAWIELMKTQILFAGGVENSIRHAKLLERRHLLDSYYAVAGSRTDKSKEGDKEKRMKELELFLDSGAFSAFTQGEVIDIQDYIIFIKKYKKYLTHYAVLDVIPPPPGVATEEDYAKSAKATYRNQRIMEKAGLKPVPCFHYGEKAKWLNKYIEQGPFLVALGGMVPVKSKELKPWLDRMFRDHICGDDGMPKTHIHGFGMTTVELMCRYPWYSVDSTSWVKSSRFGSIFVPRIKGGKYRYDITPWTVNVSNRSPSQKQEGQHFSNFTANEQKVISRYLKKKGYEFGVSEKIQLEEVRDLDSDDEKWFDKDALMVEKIIERGVSNWYMYRDELNIIYFIDMEKNMRKYPWPFKAKPKTRTLFD